MADFDRDLKTELPVLEFKAPAVFVVAIFWVVIVAAPVVAFVS